MLTLRQRKWLTLAGCVALMLAILIGASFFVPIYGNICSENQQPGHEECPRYHITLVIGWHIAKALDAASVVVTALATGFIAWFTWTLRRSTDKLWEAGEKQFVLSRDTARRQLRAYPGVTGAEIRIDTGKIYIGFNVENLSTTPAYEFKHALEYEILPIGVPVLWREIDLSDMQWDMAPHSKTTMRVRGEISEAETVSLRMSEIALIIWGRVEYRDAFQCSRYIKFMYRQGSFTQTIDYHRFESGGIQARTIYVCTDPEPFFYQSN